MLPNKIILFGNYMNIFITYSNTHKCANSYIAVYVLSINVIFIINQITQITFTCHVTLPKQTEYKPT